MPARLTVAGDAFFSVSTCVDRYRRETAIFTKFKLRNGRKPRRVADLEHHLDVVRHGHAVAVRQRQDLVVVQDRVQILDPDRVDGPVGRDPRVVGVVPIAGLGPHGRKDARRPLLADRIDLAVHLLRSNSFRVEAARAMLQVHYFMQYSS